MLDISGSCVQLILVTCLPVESEDLSVIAVEILCKLSHISIIFGNHDVVVSVEDKLIFFIISDTTLIERKPLLFDVLAFESVRAPNSALIYGHLRELCNDSFYAVIESLTRSSYRSGLCCL